MNDEEYALLTACAADPTNDLPRLEYAAWLDEHNQPARAEFVRLSVYAADPSHDAKSRAVNQSRADELLAAHWPDWDRPLTALGAALPPHWLSSASPVEYDRGLAVGVTLPLAAFLARGDTVHAAAPTVARLNLGGQWLEDADIARLAACQHLAGFTELRLNNNEFGSAGAAALAASPHVRGLTNLNLHLCRQIGDDGWLALRDSPHFRPNMTITTYAAGKQCQFDEFQQLVDRHVSRPGSGRGR